MTAPINRYSNAEIAEMLVTLTRRLDAIDDKLSPINDLYRAATWNVRMLKWGLSVLAALAALYAVGRPHT